MGMHDAVDLGTRGMHRRMDGESGGIHEPALLARLVHDAPLHIDFHQIGSTHFVKEQAVLVDQEMVFRPRDTRADMRKNQIRHAKVGHKPIKRGQIVTLLPFGFTHSSRPSVMHANVHGCFPPEYGGIFRARFPSVKPGPKAGYFILASRKTTCLRTTGSYFFSSSLPVWLRVFFLVT